MTISVLYVDDEPDLLELCKVFLEMNGEFKVDTLTSVKEALIRLKSIYYDAIISDYQMPEMDGITFLKILRESGNDIPFIVFTGRGREEVVIEAFNSGADFYLQKGGLPKAQFAELSNQIRIAVERRTSEKSLKESEEYYRIVADLTYDWEYWIAPDAKFNYISPSCERITGYSPEEFYLDPNLLVTITHPDDRNKIIDYFSSLQELHDDHGVLDFRIITRDGEERWIGHEYQSVYDSNGYYLGKRGSIRDITERKKAEYKLQNSIRFLNSIIDQSPTSTWISDEKGTLIHLNRACCNLFNITKEEVVGQYNIFSDNLVENQGFLPLVRDVFDKQKVVHFEIIYDTSKLQNVKLIKSTFTILEVTIFPIFDTDGEISNAVVQHTNITDRKLAEKALRTKSDQIQQYLDVAGVMLVVLDRDGTISMINRKGCEILEYSKEEILGQNWFQKFLPVESQAEIKEIFDKIMNGNFASTEYYENSVLTKTKKKRIIAFHNTPMSGPEGIIGVLFSGNDITVQKQMENELRENEEKYRTYIDNSPDGIFIVDATGNYLDANPSACSMVGYSHEELLTLSIRDLNPLNSPKNSLLRFVKLKKTGKLKEELLLQKKNGETIPVILNAVELPNEKYIAFCTDITEHKQYEQQISEHSHFLSTLMDTLPISIFYKDVEGKYLGCNIQFEEYIGTARSDLIGKTVHEIFPKDLADIYKAADQTVFESRIIQNYETELIFFDGTRHNVIFYKAPFINNDGSVGGLIGTFLDITERKKVENALLESEQFTKEIIYNAKEGIIVYDRNFNYLIWNPFMELLTGITEPEALGKNAFDLFPHLLEQKVDILLKRALNGEVLQSPDIPYYVPKTKKSGWISGIYSPHFNGIREIIGIIGIIRDITDSKQFEEALDKANKKLNLLSDVNRHDIKNKVIAIQGFLQLARKRKSIEEIKPFLDKIEHSLKVIENRIDFSKDYQNLGILKPKWMKLSTIIAMTGNPAINIINETGSFQVFADPLFERVLHNLIDNTIRHGETATEVHISVITNNDNIRIIWSDNGVGIPSNQKEIIFERGFGKNTGLGLFLSREILAITGMTIKETGELGKGARFEITVPNGKWRFFEDLL